MICSKQGCQEQAEVKYCKTSRYCLKHYRFKTMRNCAKANNKKVPSFDQLEKYLSDLKDFRCPGCGKIMVWRAKKMVGIGDVVSLQHWKDGTMSFLCLGCNIAKGSVNFMRDVRERIPSSKKRCQRCKHVKDRENYQKDKNRKDGLFGLCRQCNSERRKAKTTL